MENRRLAKNKYLPLFGGIYLDVRNNILIVNIKDLSIANDPDLDPFRHFLSFRLNNLLNLRPWNSSIPARDSYRIGNINSPPINYTILYDFAAFSWRGIKAELTSLIRNTDNQDFVELKINTTITEVAPGHHICHSDFETHVTCGNVKELRGIYIKEDGSYSEGLIFTDMYTNIDDLGGATFFYKPEI
ncbi:hypothetical protein F8M41_016712 [Gigaspora margarita]|uniref:Uncharacterized protein n=1 Tax=Gigaspora margarita TaxID=4874 RepID=A0A8H4AP22_GIGMA|nr:hypothetical protein F8M41_016712 [Gigaspora margarita]